MKIIAVSRRALFEGPLMVAAVAGVSESARAQAGQGLDPRTEAIIRKHYKAWVDKDWPTEDALLADDFTFSSAAGDDHISKAVFKTRCWDNNAKDIKRSNLLNIFGRGNEAFVKYDCTTMDNKTFRNVEYFRLRDEKIVALECYFGAPSNFPAAVTARKA